MKRLLLVAALLAAAAFAATWPSDIWPAPVPAPGSEAEVARHASAMQPAPQGGWAAGSRRLAHLAAGPAARRLGPPGGLRRLRRGWPGTGHFHRQGRHGRIRPRHGLERCGQPNVHGRRRRSRAGVRRRVRRLCHPGRQGLSARDRCPPGLAAEGRLVLILSRPDSDVRLQLGVARRAGRGSRRGARLAAGRDDQSRESGRCARPPAGGGPGRAGVAAPPGEHGARASLGRSREDRLPGERLLLTWWTSGIARPTAAPVRPRRAVGPPLPRPAQHRRRRPRPR